MKSKWVTEYGLQNGFWESDFAKMRDKYFGKFGQSLPLSFMELERFERDFNTNDRSFINSKIKSIPLDWK